MNPHRQSNQRRVLSVLGPVLGAAAVTALLAGCNSTPATTDDSASSSSAAYVSSTGAMMRDEGTEASEAGLPDDEDNAMNSASSQSAPAMNDSSKPSAAATDYADGTYSATGEYRSPAGSESVDVTLTLKSGTITAATFKADSANPRSKNYQNMFAQAYTDQVVGRPIDGLSLGVVNGSSLTPMGFMDAVKKIEAEASAK